MSKITSFCPLLSCRSFKRADIDTSSPPNPELFCLFPQERPAERGRLHQVGERHQPVQAPPRRDHQLAEEHRGARGAGGGVRPAPLR